jgi:GNAT superfamily N-acetyltransferase
MRERWHGPFVVTKGVIHDTRQLEGIVACEDGHVRGLLLFCQNDSQIEVVTLDALEQRRGIGRMLLDAISRCAQLRRTQRLWLVTSNDNVGAVAFYTRCGFRLVAVHLDAITKARELKPDIPSVSANGVEIRDELEFEKIMPTKAQATAAAPGS